MAAQSVPVTPSAVLSALGALNIADPNTATSNTATSNIVTSTTTDLQLPNFPIPRELRDQIYGYLLHSDYTRIAREHEKNPNGGDGPFKHQGYRFHTNVLAVNKAIHDETEEYLYKNNFFVVASAEWHLHGFLPGESLFSGNFWAPIVTEMHAARMRHHSLRLHITRGQNAEFDRLDRATGSRMKVPIQSCVIMANDLHAMCMTLRCHALQYPGFAILVEDDPVIPSPNDIKVLGTDERDGKLDRSTRLKIQFRDTPFRIRDSIMQSKMIDSLRQIVCAGLRVTFDGVLPEHMDRAQTTKDAMGPVLISRQATYWDSLEILCKAKQLADNAMCLGELHFAERSYSLTIGDTYKFIDTVEKASLPNALHISSPTVYAVNVLRLDLALTLSYLQMRLGKQRELKMTTMYLLNVTSELRCDILEFGETTSTTPESAQAVCSHLALLSKMYLEKMHYPNRPSSIFVGDMVEALTEYKQFPHFAHDLAILRKVPNQRDTALKHLPLHKCSVSVLPPRRFSYHRFPRVPHKPDDIDGIQKPDSFRRLDHDTKMEINDTQRHYGQRVTEWE